ncbi:hypothetical protein CEXT_658331 [Caerostris extrusa]|uniref:Uncharacterized protein n=1 Tax=Caerostris extrusa TaxID=172846 RepID=A0AAV4R233_CAEEX|nr:hypothetical protein CEXT_658331 [Caerostris extrusa]
MACIIGAAIYLSTRRSLLISPRRQLWNLHGPQLRDGSLLREVCRAERIGFPAFRHSHCPIPATPSPLRIPLHHPLTERRGRFRKKKNEWKRIIS